MLQDYYQFRMIEPFAIGISKMRAACKLFTDIKHVSGMLHSLVNLSLVLVKMQHVLFGTTPLPSSKSLKAIKVASKMI